MGRAARRKHRRVDAKVAVLGLLKVDNFLRTRISEFPSVLTPSPSSTAVSIAQHRRAGQPEGALENAALFGAAAARVGGSPRPR